MRTLLSVLLTTGVLVAQTIPVADGSRRVVQMFDLQQLLADATGGEADAGAAPVARNGRDERGSCTAFGERVATVIRTFLDPPLGPGDDIAPLGDRWLAAIGSPTTIAAIERFWQVAREARNTTLEVTPHVFRIDAATFAGRLEQTLTRTQRADRTTWETVVDRRTGAALAAELAGVGESTPVAMKLTSEPIAHASLGKKHQTSYVKDFTLVRSGTSTIADPVIDVAWSGYEVDIVAALLPDGTIGVSCGVTMQEVALPIPTFTTKVPGLDTPIQIQLPSIRGLRLQQNAQLAAGSMVVLAAQEASGDYIVAMIAAAAGPAPAGK